MTRTEVRLSESEKEAKMLVNLIVKTAEFLWDCIKSPVGQELLSEWEQFISTGDYNIPADGPSGGQAQTTNSRRGVPSDTGAQ